VLELDPVLLWVGEELPVELGVLEPGPEPTRLCF
jgi:hypothetical protein